MALYKQFAGFATVLAAPGAACNNSTLTAGKTVAGSQWQAAAAGKTVADNQWQLAVADKKWQAVRGRRSNGPYTALYSSGL